MHKSSSGSKKQIITPNDGNWHHVMGTFDGTTDANGLKYMLMALYFKQLLEVQDR